MTVTILSGAMVVASQGLAKPPIYICLLNVLLSVIMPANGSMTAYPLKPARAHEVCGAGKIAFAFMLAARLGGQVMWVQKVGHSECMNPEGFANIFDPSNILITRTKTQIDTLAVAEEALRSGAVQLVVYELDKPISLTAGRRLQLAAQAGQALGLGLINDDMGSNAAETRWHVSPVFDPIDSTLQNWNLIKNKSGTKGAWNVRWDTAAHRVDVVPPTGDRSGS